MASASLMDPWSPDERNIDVGGHPLHHDHSSPKARLTLPKAFRFMREPRASAFFLRFVFRAIRGL